MESVRLGDAELYSELVTPAVVWVPPGGEAIVGRTAFRAWVERFFAEFAYELDLRPQGVLVKGDWALEQGGFVSAFHARSSGSRREHRGTYALLWQRCPDGAWRIDRYFDTTEE